MQQPKFSSLPIIVSGSNRIGCFRILHIMIAVPLVAAGAFGVYWGDMSGLGLFAVAAVISGFCEFLTYWLNRDVVPSRHEIDVDGVHYFQDQARWFEPLSAYSGIDWIENHPVGDGIVDWRVELRHRTNPARTVVLLEAGRFGRDMDTELEAWHRAKEFLNLPGQRLDTLPWDQSRGETETDTVATDLNISPEAPASAISLRRSALVWGVVVFAIFSGAVLFYQQIADQGGGGELTQFGGLTLLVTIGFALLLGWGWKTVQVGFDGQAVTIKTSYGPFSFNRQIFASRHLRDVSVSFNHYGAASVSLHWEDHAPVHIRSIRSGDARRLRDFALKIIKTP